jgi:putative ABC transport system ATP-binding protein
MTMTAAGSTTDYAARVYDAVKIYGTPKSPIVALDDVTVGFPLSRLTAIIGASGSGKSALVRCASGLDRLTSGRAFIGDVELGRLDSTQLSLLRRDRIGFVFRAHNLLPTLTAEENVLLPLTLAKRRVDRVHMGSIVDAVGIGDRMRRQPGDLTPAEQLRTAIARALVTRPDIVFCDEPTGNLDTRSGGEVLFYLRSAVDQLHQTVVVATHDPHAASFADLVLFQSDGQIIDHMHQPTEDRILDRMKRLGD